jgi:hypothetical protein
VETRPKASTRLDFIHNQFARGKRFRVLNVAEDVNRKCLAAIPDKSISGRAEEREFINIIA